MYFRPPFRTKIYNIFHPFDPLGYRLEPMVNSDYETVEPVHIDRMKRPSSLPKIPNLGIRSSIAKGKPLLQSFWQYVSSTVIQNNSETSSTSSSSGIQPTGCSTIGSITAGNDFTDEDDNATLCQKRKDDAMDIQLSFKKLKSDEQKETLPLSNSHQEDVFTSNTSNDKDGHEFISGKDGQTYPRTDYVLSENMIDAYASEWIVALKSHFRYWANR
jgi:hypothetical protein